jgi:hypothetical protein
MPPPVQHSPPWSSTVSAPPVTRPYDMQHSAPPITGLPETVPMPALLPAPDTSVSALIVDGSEQTPHGQASLVGSDTISASEMEMSVPLSYVTFPLRPQP